MAERLTPLSERIARVDGTRERRLFPYDRWVKSGGVLVPVEDTVDLDYDDKSGRFTVAAAGRWVSVEPADPGKIAARTREVRTGGRRFGPVLDKDASLDGDEDFIVRFSEPSVKARASEYVLAEHGGVRVGLFLQDWQRHLGRGNVYHDAARSRTGEDLFVLRLGNVRKKTIDLDPELLNLSSIHTYAHETAESVSTRAGWDAVRGAPSSLNVYAGWCYLEISEGCMGSWWDRIGVRFDTSAVPAVDEWSFHIRTEPMWTATGHASIAARRVELSSSLSDLANFGRILTHSLGTVGMFGPCDTDGKFFIRSGLTTMWEGTHTFDIAVLADVDHTDGFDTFATDYVYLYGGLYDDPGPYLQYLEPPEPNRSPIVIGARHRARSRLNPAGIARRFPR